MNLADSEQILVHFVFPIADFQSKIVLLAELFEADSELVPNSHENCHSSTLPKALPVGNHCPHALDSATQLSDSCLRDDILICKLFETHPDPTLKADVFFDCLVAQIEIGHELSLFLDENLRKVVLLPMIDRLSIFVFIVFDVPLEQGFH